MIYRIWRVRDVETGWLYPQVYYDEEAANQAGAAANFSRSPAIVEESTLDDGLPETV